MPIIKFNYPNISIKLDRWCQKKERDRERKTRREKKGERDREGGGERGIGETGTERDSCYKETKKRELKNKKRKIYSSEKEGNVEGEKEKDRYTEREEIDRERMIFR